MGVGGTIARRLSVFLGPITPFTRHQEVCSVFPQSRWVCAHHFLAHTQLPSDEHYLADMGQVLSQVGKSGKPGLIPSTTKAILHSPR